MKYFKFNRIALALICLTVMSGAASAKPLWVPTKYSAYNEQWRSAGATPILSYFGGSVISKVQIYAVYWGENVTQDVKENMPEFYSTLVNKKNLSWLKEYNTAGVTSVNSIGGTQQQIKHGDFRGAITIHPFNAATTIKNSQIRNEIEAQINAHHLPKPDGNTLFMIHFPSRTCDRL